MSKPRVLYVCHGHPSLRPGGAEVYALELYRGMREQGEFEPVFLAKGSRGSGDLPWHPGTQFGLVDGEANQYLLSANGYHFDWLYHTITDKQFYTRDVHEFLLAVRPDIVHFQHTVYLGYDMILQVKNTLPEVPIVYTLHEYYPICRQGGHMIRTVRNEELCERDSPERCHECFPDVSPQMFFMRKRFIQSHLSLVDVFLAPSRFLRERYVEWGIPAEKIRFEEYGRQPVSPLPDDGERRRDRFGYFGQLASFKGVHVLLNAMKLLAPHGSEATATRAGRPSGPAAAGDSDPSPANQPHLWVHGANLELQPGSYQNEIRSHLEATKENVTLVGRYVPTDLPRLMQNVDWVVVPSIWWENSPLVIQEAFAFGRPVICSGIGAMVEKVSDRINGLHFRVNDPVDLARVMAEAANAPGLWEQLRGGIPPVYGIKDHVKTLAGVYRELLERKLAGRGET
jgi:glycosyltransferase involved in cell wall biosynthesis